jgi:predicted acylesterase/phospholipase RssA
MTLRPDQRAELEALGAENVRIRLMVAGTNIGACVGGFKTGDMDRGDVEDWLGKKHASKVHFDRVVLLAAIVAAVTGVLTVAHDYLK